MSFALTTLQVRARSKTVTRRSGWLFLKPGDHLQAVVKGQGLRKGERVERICEIVVESARRERLEVIDTADVVREGFAHGSVVRFVDMYLDANGGTARQWVTRIEFAYV